MLSRDESLRFQRAMYRYWLSLGIADPLTILYHVEGVEDDEEEEEDDDDDDDLSQGRMWRALRTGFVFHFQALSTDELFELLCVASFCDETDSWLSVANPVLTGSTNRAYY